jgi:hypothetical protein
MAMEQTLEVPMSRSPRIRRIGAALMAGAVVGTSGAGVTAASASTPNRADGLEPGTALVYAVRSEGLTPAAAEALAGQAGIGTALRSDGSFTFTDTERYSALPTVVVGEGKDESGNAVVSEAIDIDALAATKVISSRRARSLAADLLPIPEAYGATPIVGHTLFERGGVDGTRYDPIRLDTTVSYQLDLGGIPVVGPGAKARVSFAGDRSVIQLTLAARDVEPAGSVAIISTAEAGDACAALYGPAVAQATPVLAYSAPPLAATDASGKGSVQFLLPHFVCQPRIDGSEEVELGGRLVPAAPDMAPRVEMKAAGDGSVVEAAMGVTGGQAPYAVQWNSSTTPSTSATGRRRSATSAPRRPSATTPTSR